MNKKLKMFVLNLLIGACVLGIVALLIALIKIGSNAFGVAYIIDSVCRLLGALPLIAFGIFFTYLIVKISKK